VKCLLLNFDIVTSWIRDELRTTYREPICSLQWLVSSIRYFFDRFSCSRFQTLTAETAFEECTLT
jgi:hypothetical protein